MRCFLTMRTRIFVVLLIAGVLALGLAATAQRTGPVVRRLDAERGKIHRPPRSGRIQTNPASDRTMAGWHPGSLRHGRDTGRQDAHRVDRGVRRPGLPRFTAWTMS